MNLRDAGGKIPIHVGGQMPYVLVNFPSKEKFFSLYGKRTREIHLHKFYDIVSRRVKGATLEEAGKPHGISKERVRQIEAKFLRLISSVYEQSRTSSNSGPQ